MNKKNRATFIKIIGLLILFMEISPAQDALKLRLTGEPQKLAGEIVDINRKDVNGRTAAAIHVLSDLTGLSYNCNNGFVGREGFDDGIKRDIGKDILFLQPDERVLEIAKSGYITLKLILPEEGIFLRSSEVWQVTITGDKSSIPATFLIDPPTATIFIDGENRGTEVSQMVTKGGHNVRISLDGYREIDTNITISDENTFFRFKLSEIDPVKFTITSAPTGANIELNGVFTGRTTPYQDIKFPGTYTLKLSKRDYLDTTTVIRLRENSENLFNYDLIKNMAYLKISTVPNSALLKLNGVIQADKNAEIKPGEYELEVSAPGYIAKREKISVKINETVTRNYELTKSEGTIVLAIIPKDATVLLNKQDYTGRKVINVQPDKYKLEILKSGYNSISETIDVSLGDTVTRRITLEKITGKLQFSVSPIQAKSTLKKGNAIVKTWEGAEYFKDLGVGKYSINTEAEGYYPQTKEITVEQDKTAAVSIELQSKSAGFHITEKMRTTTNIITNMEYEIQGNKIFVYYDLEGSSDEEYEVQLNLRRSKLRAYKKELKFTSGDIGDEVLAGSRKTIIWEFGREFPLGLSNIDDFYLELQAEEAATTWYYWVGAAVLAGGAAVAAIIFKPPPEEPQRAMPPGRPGE